MTSPLLFDDFPNVLPLVLTFLDWDDVCNLIAASGSSRSPCILSMGKKTPCHKRGGYGEIYFVRKELLTPSVMEGVINAAKILKLLSIDLLGLPPPLRRLTRGIGLAASHHTLLRELHLYNLILDEEALEGMRVLFNENALQVLIAQDAFGYETPSVGRQFLNLLPSSIKTLRLAALPDGADVAKLLRLPNLRNVAVSDLDNVSTADTALLAASRLKHLHETSAVVKNLRREMKRFLFHCQPFDCEF